MLSFFDAVSSPQVFAIESNDHLSKADQDKLSWLFGGANYLEESSLVGFFVGPRAAMVTPWSTNAVEITQNMGIRGITRIECFEKVQEIAGFDPMLFQKYSGLHQDIFKIEVEPESIKWVNNIADYNEKEGLALSEDEVRYLEELSNRIGRLLTDSEVFGFSQVNSEHCRHKIFNGTFIIDGEQKSKSLFQLIKETSRQNPNEIVSAYKDNVAFIKGPVIQQFAPQQAHLPSRYTKREVNSVLSLKAETHNFPTTVEPFNGAATGSGGEIRDRLAGGQGSIPLAGTAVYMTAYSRQGTPKPWEEQVPERPWLYQKPIDILIKASNGASDFGNKFGQPLIAGALLTFEHQEGKSTIGYDKVIMLAGGVGYGIASQAQKLVPQKGDKVILLGGDNYRIGMGGAAVSSADTGEFSAAIELNAVQRSNPEMQKRVANTIRALVEQDNNPIISIHDHGAGGHLNCLSELVEETGGTIYLDNLPIGDPTLSAREIIGNESQERMGLIVHEEQVAFLQSIADRERAPIYVIGEVTDDQRFQFVSGKTGDKPIDLALNDFFGSSPALIMHDQTSQSSYSELEYDVNRFQEYLEAVLQLESVACKDWLTNKVDRCVGGRVAVQQCTGIHQLPLNNCGVMALDYESHKGIATSIGQAPVAALIDPRAGSVLAITEALTNLVWAPLENGLRSVSLSANWMWPCKNPGEDARLYAAVEACSHFAIELGINIPTGKDSLSMKQKYPDGQEVLAPGTVIISAIGSCNDIRKVVEPFLKLEGGDVYYIDWSRDLPQLGGSALAQVLSSIGSKSPSVRSSSHVVRCFDTIQTLIKGGRIAAGHDISSGGLITTLLEMAFSTDGLGMQITLPEEWSEDWVTTFFAENPGVVIQAKPQVEDILHNAGIGYVKLGTVNDSGQIQIKQGSKVWQHSIAESRDIWFETSYWMDRHQSGEAKALERKLNYASAPMQFVFPEKFDPSRPVEIKPRFKAAVIREKGSNSEREMANALHLAGFEVIDVHMTDLMSGRETLNDVHFIGAVGGFSNSDVLGSAKGWAGAFLYNENARNALTRFFERNDTLSVGICNGCQLFMELGLIYPDHQEKPFMTFNDSHKHESNFVQVVVTENNSVMLSSLKGSRLGVWVSHGEGKFKLPLDESAYQITAKYAYSHYPANPNGSDYDTAMLCSHDGRHLVMMPHIERSIFPWNWAYYPEDRKQDAVSPWLEAFINARMWLESKAG
jgi:phosphoribosylformylglycinamidine synthase